MQAEIDKSQLFPGENLEAYYGNTSISKMSRN